MIRIFLAHASEDKEAVTHLYQRLKERGFAPWLDKVDLLPGQNWRAEIPKAIKASDVFLACLSKESVAKHGYIQREFRMALNEMADRPPGQIFLIPVRLDDCQIPELRQEEYGINLADYQWVDLFEPDGLDRLVKSIDVHFPVAREDALSAKLIRQIRGRCKAEGFTKSPQVPFAKVIESWIDELGTGPDLQERVNGHIAYWIIRRDNPSLSHEQVKARFLNSPEFVRASDSESTQAASASVGNPDVSDSAQPSENPNPSYAEVLARLKDLEDRAQTQQAPKYDLRGAKFAGGFAETVLGDQVGGSISNTPFGQSTPEVSQSTTKTRTIDLGNGVNLELVYVPGGNFLMGSPESEEGSRDNERPLHRVTVSDLWMGKYPVTEEQYHAVTGHYPNHFKGRHLNALPVAHLSWHNAIEFCDKLSKQIQVTTRLPSETEWEYACRAGTITRYYFGDNLTYAQANFGSTKGKSVTTSVGIYSPNAYGLYDMHGNVWEWCQDIWHDNYEGAPTDGSSWVTNGNERLRIRRGCSWYNDSVHCRSAYRSPAPPNLFDDFTGFRIVCSPSRNL
ncbi:MAG: SUMF1/EgtB/PvdO family nonheme iron enzyme [Cyanobacteria bacterium P01_H01_bin.58]